MDKAVEIFEKHIGLNAELGYLPIPREDIIDAINEALNDSNRFNIDFSEFAFLVEACSVN